jgi:DNA-binding NarL/FixJ family response regulator
LKFLVVDDHALIREAMHAVLGGLDADAVVLEAADGVQTRSVLSREADVDLVLLDLNLPDIDGLELLGQIRSAYPSTAVVMLSGNRSPEAVRAALSAGAAGFIPKTETRDVLAGALALILAGGVYVPREALAEAPAVQRAAATGAEGGTMPASLGLTERQRAVLALMMKGRSNKLICRELNLAEPTVKNHVTAVLRALGVSSRTEAVLAAARLGWKIDPR